MCIRDRCHSRPKGVFSSAKYLAGGQKISAPGEEKVTPSLLGSDESGLGTWSEQDLVAYLRTSQTPEGVKVDSRFCPVEYYSLAKEEDLQAIAAYLKSLG